MAREVDKLSARKVATIKEPGRYADGGGLYLVVDPSGAKRWNLLIQVAGKRHELGLGSANTVSLAEAREKALETRKRIVAGDAPVKRKAAATSPPFSEVAERYMADHAPSWKSAVHRRQWRQTLETHASSLWNKPVHQIAVADVLAVLRPLWHAKPETASRLRGRLERVMDAARAQGAYRGENPARWRGHLEAMLPAPRKLTRGHHAAMPYSDVPAFYASLHAREADAARMLRLIILTAARSNEVRSMKWEEIDFANAIWSIPAARMKASRPHRIPLVPEAIAILETAKPKKLAGLVFPSARSKPYSDPVFKALYTRMGIADITTHGFRSSFKDWASDETQHAREVIEAALAHVIGDKAERAYRRTDAIEKRRALLHDWARFVASGSDRK
jgi:integrase